VQAAAPGESAQSKRGVPGFAALADLEPFEVKAGSISEIEME